MHGLSEEKLRSLGFSQNADGTWSKPDSHYEVRPPGTPSPVVERSPQKVDQGKIRTEEVGEAFHREGDYYQLVIVSYRSRFIDGSNVCEKWIEDAVVQLGVLPDDSPRYCHSPICVQVQVPVKEEKTEVYLFRANRNDNTQPNKQVPSLDSRNQTTAKAIAVKASSRSAPEQ